MVQTEQEFVIMMIIIVSIGIYLMLTKYREVR